MLKLGLVLVLLSMTSLAQAKDVSALQVGVEYARENQEKAESEYKDSLQRVSNSEKRMADAQKKLDRRQAKSRGREEKSGRIQSEIREGAAGARPGLETAVAVVGCACAPEQKWCASAPYMRPATSVWPD